jgi:hypothetical protein
MDNKKSTVSEKPKRILGQPKVVTRPRKGQEELKPPDTSQLKKYLEAVLRDVHDNAPHLYGMTDFLRDCTSMSRRLDREGPTFATSVLPVIFDGTIRILEGGAASFPGFKVLKRGCITYPVVLSGLVKRVLDHPSDEIGRDALRYLYQISYAFKKVLGPYKQKVLNDQLREFIEVDDSLKYFDYLSEPLREISRRARDIITDIFSGIDPTDLKQSENFLPRPGPGATNTPRKKSERYVAHSDYLPLSQVFDMEEWFNPPSALPRQYRVQPLFGMDNVNHLAKHHKKEAKRPLEKYDTPTSRFKFVPKTNQKARGICIEENEIQWLQQALRLALVRRLESHPLTKGRVNFTSQQINRDMALISSQTGQHATLDMSSASDRISRKLVSYLFSKTQILDHILACSTETIKLPEIKGFNFIDELPINKIAPMGSAICFPIMAVTHFALIKAILEFSVVPHELNSDIYVYGDDIIVPTECVDAIYSYLPLYGMRFNEEKSFSQSRFRESCGLHAYDGFEITPTRFKIAYENLRLSDVPGILRLEEAFYNKGFRRTAELLRIQVQRCCLNKGIQSFYPVPTSSQLLGFYRPDDEATLDEFVKSVKGKEHKDIPGKPWYACKVYRVPVIANRKVVSPPLDGEPGYLRWLCQRAEKAEFVEDCPSDKTYVRWRSLPESALGFRRSADALHDHESGSAI